MGKRSARPAARRRGQHQPDPAVARDPLPLALPLVLVLALVLRLVVFVQLKDHLLLQPGGGLDTSVYVDLARQVLGGDVALGPGLYLFLRSTSTSSRPRSRCAIRSTLRASCRPCWARSRSD